MEKRVALVGVIVSNFEATEKINNILHEYREHIIGRMGIPYEKRDVAVISVALDATNDIINSLSGKLGSINGVSTKTIYSNVIG